MEQVGLCWKYVGDNMWDVVGDVCSGQQMGLVWICVWLTAGWTDLEMCWGTAFRASLLMFWGTAVGTGLEMCCGTSGGTELEICGGTTGETVLEMCGGQRLRLIWG